MVLGIVGACTSFIPIVNNASFFLGILAAIFGLIALFTCRSKGTAVAGLVLGVLSIVITLAMQQAVSDAIDDSLNAFESEMDQLDDEFDYMSGDKTDDILKNHLNVSFGSFTVTEDAYWTDTSLAVTVKNKSKEKRSFSITVEAVDRNETRIDTDTIYVRNLGAGQSQVFQIFKYVSSDQLNAMKDAHFRVESASMY